MGLKFFCLGNERFSDWKFPCQKRVSGQKDVSDINTWFCHLHAMCFMTNFQCGKNTYLTYVDLPVAPAVLWVLSVWQKNVSHIADLPVVAVISTSAFCVAKIRICLCRLANCLNIFQKTPCM